jgi:hypothetical protein
MSPDAEFRFLPYGQTLTVSNRERSVSRVQCNFLPHISQSSKQCGIIARSAGLKSITKYLMQLPRTASEIGQTVSSPGNGNGATVLTTYSPSQEIKQDAIFNGD